MKPISPFGLPLGLSITFWSLVGLFRYFWEFFNFGKKYTWPYDRPLTKKDIAVIVPAHNEELVIRSCVAALKKCVDREQIYVISDGSTDRTYDLAKKEGCHVEELTKGRGKAKAMVYLIKKFNLYNQYKLIFIVDADTRIDAACVRRALPMFRDPDIGVVFASSRIVWKQHFIPRLGFYFQAYRERLNRMLQYFLIYGQTFKYTNVNYVIPGFATIYRSKVLRKLEIDTPGLLIEDFNLAFQFHKKRLGKIGYSGKLIGWDQYPDNLADYYKQVRRWNIGFFQTVKKNGFWLSFFWVSLAVFSAEVILNSIFVLILPFVLLHLLLPSIGMPGSLADFYQWIYQGIGPYKYLTIGNIIFGIFLMDYIMTVVIGLINKKPQFIFYGLFFFFMHFVTSLILISSIIPGFFGDSSGRWDSPKRLVNL
jgi:cellulose synthase/poly-beta-1,6-N-acetylglucosamine synthase-like glycosyltransferase